MLSLKTSQELGNRLQQYTTFEANSKVLKGQEKT